MFDAIGCGISSVAIGVGVASVDPQKGLAGWGARLGLDAAGMYQQIAALGSLSAGMLAEIVASPEFRVDGLHGVYAYEVDEDFGAAIARSVRDDACFTAFDCPALRRELGHQARLFFSAAKGPIPVTLDLISKWTETMDPVLSCGASALAIGEGMGVFVATGESVVFDWCEKNGHGMVEFYAQLATLAQVGTALREAVAGDPDVVDVRDLGAYHREVDVTLGRRIAEGCLSSPAMRTIDGPHMRRELAKLVLAYFGAAERPCRRLVALVDDVIGVRPCAAARTSKC